VIQTMSAALWHITLTLLNLLRHWPFTYLSKLKQFVLFKKSLICSLVTEYAEYSVSEKEDIFGDSNKLEYHMHQWWMTQHVIFCCTVNAWSNTVMLFVIPLFCVSAKTATCQVYRSVDRKRQAFSMASKRSWLNTTQIFVWVLCKGHYVWQLCHNSVAGFSPWRSGFISRDNEMIIFRIYGIEWWWQ